MSRADVTALRPEEVELLERRAERLRAGAETQDETVWLWVAEFRMGSERLAIPLSTLRGVLPLKAVSPIPLSAPHVIGILRFQGQLITAMSLAALLRGRVWTRDPTVLLVAEAGHGHLVALDCDQVPIATRIPQSAYEDARAAATGPLVEVTTQDLQLLKVVDLARLLERRSGARDGR